ncbi:hypothetical protein SapgrDRAFT_2337 [Saprospira grandis DSM 2844]|uniref:Uncharacterized protein n=1 Tax=Saprospira grandis DSM 2844 TaxID=694433 RepID=J1I5F1_9BACT|nr:hypothetical protein SapgrDRAFT_2337 [Saprospira grandis DSM 2844]
MPKSLYSVFLGPPPRFARRRLLPLVVELRPKGLVVALGLAGLLGPASPSASPPPFASVTPFGRRTAP